MFLEKSHNDLELENPRTEQLIAVKSVSSLKSKVKNPKNTARKKLTSSPKKKEESKKEEGESRYFGRSFTSSLSFFSL